jgi:hypothetical protein
LDRNLPVDFCLKPKYCKKEIIKTVEYQSIKIVFLWVPLNGITLGQRETDSNNQLVLKDEFIKQTKGRKK